MLDAAESNALLAVSLICSVVDFWEPGYIGSDVDGVSRELTR